MTLLFVAAIPAQAYKVYYDNTATGWDHPYVYYWNPAPDWPGVPMTPYTDNPALSNIWVYDVPASDTGIIFNNGLKDNMAQTKDYKGTAAAFADCVFGFVGKDSGADVSEAYYGPLSSYTQGGGGEDVETIEYVVRFHNVNAWSNVYIRISGYSAVKGGKMESFLNSSIHDITFRAPADAEMQCSFYSLSGGQEINTTAQWPLVNGHVYTRSGDKGDYSTYDPATALPEAEFWIEPSNPSQLQEATLYFNRAYYPGGVLEKQDEIYVYPGLIATGASDKEWSGAPPTWDNLPEKYKMQSDPDFPDIFTLKFTPSIEKWFGLEGTGVYSKIALIFRDRAGNKQHGEENQFITLRQIADASAGLGAVVAFDSDGRTVTVTSEKGRLMLTPLSEQIVKVFTLPDGASVTDERPSISVVDLGGRPSYSVSESETEIVIAVDGGVTVRVDKAASTVTFCDSDGNEYLRELAGLTNTPGRISVSFDAMGDEGFYGGGYNGNRINWEGNTMVMNNTQTGGWAQGTSHPHNICVPFYVSTKGYGVYFDDHYHGATITPTATGSTYNSASRNPIAYYFIGGGDIVDGQGSMQTAVENYTRLTGLQELPPYWSLGYITSKFSFETRAEAEAAIRKTKNINIPIDAIVFDIHWQGGVQGMGRIDWDTSRYPSPQEMMQNFRNENVHTIAITEPFFTSNSGNYNYMKENGFFSDDHVENMDWLQSEHVGLIDVTKKEAIDWFKELYKKRTLEGIDGWWLDLGEPEKHDDESTYVLGDIKQVHNEYGNRWCEFVIEALRECKPDARHILMPRAGTSGMQRFNTFPWTGDILRDWGGLQAQVPALVSGAMSGVSYLGSDIGGFSSWYGTKADLYRRWVQLGVFYPSMRTHSQDKPEVWRDEYLSVRDDVRKAINMRYAYLPYTYTQSYAYTRYGTPIARPANFADADKTVLSNCIDAYLWGPDVYVAPVLTENDTRSITFPEGDWLDMNDFKSVYAGHTTTSYYASKSTIPHFMRRGSFVTRYRQDSFTNTAEIETDRITVHYFPSKGDIHDSGIFYDDDHTSVSPIENRRFVLTHFTGEKSANGGIVINITRDGDGWDGIYDGKMQDMMFAIHGLDFIGNIGMAGVSAAAAGPMKAAPVANFKQLDSADAVAQENTSNSYAVDGNTLYVRMPNLRPRYWYTLSLDGNGVTVGNDAAAAVEAMTLSYGGGSIAYSAPASTSDLSLRVFNTTGSLVAEYTGLSADGYVARLDVDLAAGAYIARLDGRDAAGTVCSKTLKMLVR